VFADIALPLALVLIMGSLGLTLTPADFKRVVTAPKGVGIGLLNLLLLSPLLAFAIGEVYGLAATLAVGVVLLGASPGGTTANMLTHLARGDVALSVSMTAVSSVASVITVPLFLSLAASHFDAQDVSDEISMPGIAARVFLITIVPLSIGMLIRARRTAWTLRWMGTARKAAMIAFVVVVIGAVLTELDLLADAFAEIAIAVVTLNVAAMTLSFLIARAARLDNRQSTAIAMELGVHNTTVALAVATTIGDDLAGPAAVYGLFMFVTAGLFAKLMARRNAPAAEVVLDAPAQEVWRAGATEDGLAAWLAPAVLEGGELRLDLGEGMGQARAHVTSFEAPLRFAFAERDPHLETVFTLEEVGGGRTRLSIAHRGDEAAVRQAAASWDEPLAKLREHVSARTAVAA
jgi:bile acid:Na+ symporter, BASS family